MDNKKGNGGIVVFLITLFFLLVFFIFSVGYILQYSACKELIDKGYDANFFIEKDGYIGVCYVQTIYNEKVRYYYHGDIIYIDGTTLDMNEKILKKR